MIYRNKMGLLIGLAVVALAVACQKNNSNLPGGNVKPGDSDPQEEEDLVTITVGLPEEGLVIPKASVAMRSARKVILLDDFGDADEADATGEATKVALVEGDNYKVIKPMWEAGDQISVNGKTFTLKTGEDGKNVGEFTGPDPGEGPYIISLLSNLHTPADYNNQTQASDGDMAHLGYAFTMTNAPCYGQDAEHLIQLTQDWAEAKGATISNQPSVLRLRALLPASIASNVKKVIFKSSADVFNGSNTLTVNLTTPGTTGTDNILDVYATLPYADPAPTIPDILVQFQVSDNAYDKYSFYHIFNGTVSGGCTHVVNIACTNIENNANRQAKSGGSFVPADNVGTSANPYYVGDKNQLAKVHDELGASTTYFKLVDDIDCANGNMRFNHEPPYDKVVDFDGNGKTISNRTGRALFYVFRGNARNLTLNNFTINNGTKRSVFAEFIQGTGNVINNVDITNSTVATGGDETGALVALINSGTTGVVSATISNCDIVNTSVTGGANTKGTGALIGEATQKVVITDCTVSDGSAVSGIHYVGGLIGIVTGAGSSVTDCSVSETDITGAARVGGIMGDAGAAMTVSGCSYSDGTISYDDDLVDTEKKYFGGVVGFIENYEIIFQDCHVTGDVTIDVSAKVGDARTGGFVGQNYNAGTIKGCSVGTSLKKVLLKTNVPDPTAGPHNQPINVGGFAGVNYGLITKNGEVSNEAHAKIESNNDQDFQVNLGGFVGYHRGTIEYSDADADLSGLTGQFIGGFCGRLVDENNNPTVTRHNRVLGSTVVSGTDIVGGYAGGVNKEITEGYTPDITVDDCQVASGVTVSGAHTLGGFAGKVEYGVFTSSSSAAAVTGGSKLGGFLGENDTNAVSFSDCQASGNVTGNAAAGQYIGGFVGHSKDFATTYTDCRVRDSIIDLRTITGDPLGGGFAGLLETSVQALGCSVGVSGTPVQVKMGAPSAHINLGGAGGFAGSCLGTVSQNGGTRTTVYATLTSTNATTDRDINLGGFAGFLQGSVSYCDANVTMTGLTGQRIGGFAGRVDGHATKSVVCDHCTVSGSVSASNGQGGGFVGRVYGGTVVPSFTNNTVSGSISGGAYLGGFAGYSDAATYTANTTSMSVNGTSNYVGGFVGVAAGGTYSGTRADGGAHSTSKASGNVEGAGSYVGGFVGAAFSPAGSFDCCDATGTVSSSSYSVGGFIGQVSDGDWHFAHCRYWGTSVSSSFNDSSNYVDVGGFCGRAYVAFTGYFRKCWVSQGSNGLSVSAPNGKGVGGFIGRVGTTTSSGSVNTGIIEKCLAHKVTVTGGQYTGGFAGVSYVSISECGVSGAKNVTSAQPSVGGFVGYQQYNGIQYCFTFASAKGNTTDSYSVGGFAGTAKDAEIVQSYVGAVSPTGKDSSLGAFIGTAESGSQSKCIAWWVRGWYGVQGTSTYTQCHRKTATDTYVSSWAATYGWDTAIWNVDNFSTANINDFGLRETTTILDL